MSGQGPYFHWLRFLIARLHDSGKVPFVIIGLDIVPNGYAAALRSYTEHEGYYWIYARSPTDMTRLLADRFGTPVLILLHRHR
jgi:hypothetical protein